MKNDAKCALRHLWRTVGGLIFLLVLLLSLTCVPVSAKYVTTGTPTTVRFAPALLSAPAQRSPEEEEQLPSSQAEEKVVSQEKAEE